MNTDGPRGSNEAKEEENGRYNYQSDSNAPQTRVFGRRLADDENEQGRQRRHQEQHQPESRLSLLFKLSTPCGRLVEEPLALFDLRFIDGVYGIRQIVDWFRL